MFECGICKIQFTTLIGLECHARHRHPFEESGLTEDEYKAKVLNRTAKKSCSICGHVDYAFTFTRGRPLCRDCVSKYAVHCPICGSLITWQAGLHFTKCHPDVKMPDIGELKAVRCRECNQIIRMTRVPYGVRERDILEVCDSCKKNSLVCPCCGDTVLRTKNLYAHLMRCYPSNRNTDMLLDDYIQNLPDGEFRTLALEGLQHRNELGRKGNKVHSDRVRGRSFSDIYGDRAEEIRSKISNTMIGNGNGWKFWKSYSDSEVSNVIIAKTKKRRDHYPKYFTEESLNRIRVHAAEIRANRYSKVSRQFFQKLDESLGLTGSLYAESEKMLKLSEGNSLGKYSVFLDYYNESVDLVVEFFGDFWHANPLMYFPDAVMHDGLTAEDIWERDFKRINLISKTMNPRFLFIVWESNQDRMLEVITDAINHARTVEQICRKA